MMFYSYRKPTHKPGMNIYRKLNGGGGGKACFSIFSTKSRGVAILFKPSLNLKILSCVSDEEGRYIILQIEMDNSVFILVNVYGPNEDNPDFFFIEVFEKLCELGSSNIIFAGDLNIAMGPMDYKG